MTTRPHPTCIEVTSYGDRVNNRRSWLCGLDCPRPKLDRAGRHRAFVYAAPHAATAAGPWQAAVRWWDDNGKLIGLHVFGGPGTSWEVAAQRAQARVERIHRNGWIRGGTAIPVSLP